MRFSSDLLALCEVEGGRNSVVCNSQNQLLILAVRLSLEHEPISQDELSASIAKLGVVGGVECVGTVVFSYAPSLEPQIDGKIEGGSISLTYQEPKQQITVESYRVDLKQNCLACFKHLRDCRCERNRGNVACSNPIGITYAVSVVRTECVGWAIRSCCALLHQTLQSERAGKETYDFCKGHSSCHQI